MEIYEMHERGGIWCWGHVPLDIFKERAREDGYTEVDGVVEVDATHAWLRAVDEDGAEIVLDLCEAEESGANPITYMVF